MPDFPDDDVERVARAILIEDENHADYLSQAAIPEKYASTLAQAALAAAWEWRPIESAPRDGTEILAISQGKHEITGRAFVPAVVWWDIYGEGWTEKEGEAGDAGWDLTHWMPLPPAPEVKP